MREHARSGRNSVIACSAIRLQRSTSSAWISRARSGVGSLAHPVERPREVDGGRSRRPQHPIRLVEVVAEQGGEHVAVCGRDADGGRAADGERPDRLGHFRRAPALELDLFVG